MANQTEINEIIVKIFAQVLNSEQVTKLRSEVEKLSSSIAKVSSTQDSYNNALAKVNTLNKEQTKSGVDVASSLDAQASKIKLLNKATLKLIATDERYKRLKDDLIKSKAITESGELAGGFSSIRLMSTASPIVDKYDKEIGTRISNVVSLTEKESGAITRVFNNTRKYIDQAARDSQNAISGLFEKLNLLRWSMVNITFIARTLSMIAKPFVDATKAGMEWELQLKRIQMVNLDILKTSKDMENVAGIIIGGRKGTPYSTTEAGSAFLEYTKAGFSVTEATEALPHILNLATIGMTDLGVAGTIVAQTMHAFSIEGVSAEKAVNIISLAANKSALSVQTFGSSLSYVGPIAANMGIKLSETAAALSLLSNQGLRGTQAGTALRQVLSSMSEPTREAEELMNRLGISYHDVEGNSKGLTERLKTLYFALENLTAKEKEEALGKLFNIRGKVAVTAFLNLLSESTTAMDDMADMLENDVSYASDAASKAMESSMLRMQKSMNNLKTSLITFRDTFVQSFTYILDIIEPVTAKLAELNTEFPVIGTILGGATQLLAIIGSIAGITALVGGFKALAVSGGAFATFVNGATLALNALVPVALAVSAILAVIAGFAVGFKGSKEGGFLDELDKRIDKLLGKDTTITNFIKKLNDLTLLVAAAPLAWGKAFQKWTMPSETELLEQKLKEQERILKESEILEKEYSETRQRALAYFRQEYQKWVDDLRYANMPLIDDFKQYIDQYELFIKEFAGSASFRTELEKNKKFIEDQIPVVIEYYTTIKNEEQEITRLNSAIKVQNELLSDQKDALSAVNNQIKLLSTARYTGQIGIERLIENVDQSIKRNKWNTYGLGDAYSWLQAQLKSTSGDYEQYLAIVNEVNAEVESSKDKFKAWQDTITEFIRNQIIQGNDLKVNMTDTVRAYSTLLLQTNKYGDAQKKEKSGEEVYLSLLKEAYDLYYGSMENNVKLAIQAHEDEKNGVYANSVVVIKALENKWKVQSKYESAIKLTEDSIKNLNAELKTHNDIIDDTNTKMESLKDTVLELIYSLNLLKEPSGLDSWFSILGNIQKVTYNPNLIGNSTAKSVVSEPAKVSSVSQSSFYSERQKMIDAGIITPMASGGLVTQPTFAMIGEAGPELVIPLNRSNNVGGANLNINQLTISGVSGDYNVFAREFINTIKRELRSI